MDTHKSGSFAAAESQALMCNSATCFHGECVAQQTSPASVDVCACKTLYAGAQCSFRNGNLYFEVPLACTCILLLLVMGVRVAEKAKRMLSFPETSKDCFAFPRAFVRSERASAGFVSQCIGVWTGDTTKGVPIRKKVKEHMLENMLMLTAIVLELVMWLQVTAIAFLPVVPWPSPSKNTADFLRLFILYPLWTHVDAHQFPRQLFYFAVAAVPVGLLLACLLGIKRFPLFKPQPKDSPVEDLCSMALRLYSEWAVIPTMIALLLPFECLFVGYGLKGFLVALPIPESTCFTLLQGGQVCLGFAVMSVYWLLSCVIAFQLNCESSHPVPALWTDLRYMAIAQITKAPLALSVVAFMNSNAILLCISCVLVSLTLGFVTAWMRPCAHSLINGLRVYGSALSGWSAAMGLVTAVMDNPTNKTTYEIWSLGAIGLSGASISALLLYHTEDFWFRLGLLATSKQVRSDDSTRGDIAAFASQLPDEVDDDETKSPKLIRRIMACVRRSAFAASSKQLGSDARVAVAAVSSQAQEDELAEDRQVEVKAGPSKLVSKLAMLRRAKAQKRYATSTQ